MQWPEAFRQKADGERNDTFGAELKEQSHAWARRDRRRGTHMWEWHRAELEGDTDDDERRSLNSSPIRFGPITAAAALTLPSQRARDAVDHRHAVQQAAGGDRAKTKYLHRGLRDPPESRLNATIAYSDNASSSTPRYSVTRLLAEISTMMPSSANRPSTKYSPFSR